MSGRFSCLSAMIFLSDWADAIRPYDFWIRPRECGSGSVSIEEAAQCPGWIGYAETSSWSPISAAVVGP
jgi:hypothetical protein